MPIAEGTQVMDFFAHQEAARKSTKRLVLLFMAAVVSIVLAIYLVIAAIFAGSGSNGSLWNAELFAVVAGVTVACIALGSLYKIGSLASGGEAVARSLGGSPIDPGTSDPDERKLLNVVEEMSIASGLPVPAVYLLDNEPGINAFAAGHTPQDAVIGVTRGCVQQLSRDELQGVIAHEFSHILNGDMRLNIRLMGILFGIVMLSMIGYITFRICLASGGSRRRSRDSKEGGAVIAIMVIGLLIWIIGWVGVFFGRLIKAAVSRQREFLADAAAVQFTRNPAGIAGALKKIGGYSQGSKLASPQAEEASHMFFGNALTSPFAQAMATHPPLEERIKRIDRSFAPGDEKPSLWREHQAAQEGVAGVSALAGGGVQPRKLKVDPRQVADRVGSLTDEAIDYATHLRESLPPALCAAARDPYSARAVICALLLDGDAAIRERQLAALAAQPDVGLFLELKRLLPALATLPAEGRLPLADLALPALKRLAGKQYVTFRAVVDQLVNADDQIDLFEYALQRSMKQALEPVFSDKKVTLRTDRKLAQVADSGAVLLSALANVGSDDEREAARAFGAGAVRLEPGVTGLSLLPASRCGLGEVDRALEELSRLNMDDRRKLIQACAAIVAIDGEVTIAEAELLRAVAASLGCPMPPLAAEPAGR